MTPGRADAPGSDSEGTEQALHMSGCEPIVIVPERQFPPGPMPDLRLSRDPEESARLLIEQLGGATIAARWISLTGKALSREYRP